MQTLQSIRILIIMFVCAGFWACERTDPAAMEGSPSDLSARATATAAQVYDQNPQAFEDRLEALAAGMVNAAENRGLKDIIKDLAQMQSVDQEFRTKLETVSQVYSTRNGDFRAEVELSALDHGSSGQSSLAGQSVEGFTVNGKNFEPVITIPAMDPKVREALIAEGWDGITPSYITTTESYVSDTQIRAYTPSGNSILMDPADLASLPVWVIGIEVNNDDGSGVQERLVVVKYYCPGEDNESGCDSHNSGKLCAWELWGSGRGRILSLTGIRDCGGNNQN